MCRKTIYSSIFGKSLHYKHLPGTRCAERHLTPAYLESHYIINIYLAPDVQKDTLLQHIGKSLHYKHLPGTRCAEGHHNPAYLASHHIINTYLILDVQKGTLLQHHQSEYNYAVPMEGEDNLSDDIQFQHTGHHQDI